MILVNDPVQSLWIGRLSTIERLSICSFLAHGHPVHLYVYDLALDVPEGTTLLDAREILPQPDIDMSGRYPHGPRHFSNLFRYTLLLRKGGWWVDLDMVCLKPWSFPEPYVFAFEIASVEHMLGGLGNRIIACEVMKLPAGDELMRQAIAAMEAVDISKLKHGDTGPHLMTKLIRPTSKRFERFERYVLPKHTFFPIDVPELPRIFLPDAELPHVEHAHGMHLWNAAWGWHSFDKDRAYPPTCLYERLKAQYLTRFDAIPPREDE